MHEYLPLESQCKCPCHTPGVVMLHCFPCCKPDPIEENEMGQQCVDPNDPKELLTSVYLAAGGMDQPPREPPPNSVSGH